MSGSRIWLYVATLTFLGCDCLTVWENISVASRQPEQQHLSTEPAEDFWVGFYQVFAEEMSLNICICRLVRNSRETQFKLNFYPDNSCLFQSRNVHCGKCHRLITQPYQILVREVAWSCTPNVDNLLCLWAQSLPGLRIFKALRVYFCFGFNGDKSGLVARRAELTYWCLLVGWSFREKKKQKSPALVQGLLRNPPRA